MSTPAARSLSYLSYDRTTAIGFPFFNTKAVLSFSDSPRISFEDCPLLNSPILKCSIGTLLFFSKVAASLKLIGVQIHTSLYHKKIAITILITIFIYVFFRVVNIITFLTLLSKYHSDFSSAILMFKVAFVGEIL